MRVMPHNTFARGPAPAAWYPAKALGSLCLPGGRAEPRRRRCRPGPLHGGTPRANPELISGPVGSPAGQLPDSEQPGPGQASAAGCGRCARRREAEPAALGPGRAGQGRVGPGRRQRRSGGDGAMLRVLLPARPGGAALRPAGAGAGPGPGAAGWGGPGRALSRVLGEGRGASWVRGRPPGPARPRVVDLRSDTVTRPSAAMRRAMARAAVGDDDYGEDPTVNVMCHCQRRGAQLLLGREAHLHVFEHGGVAQVAGVHSQALQDLPGGTLDLDQLESAIREAAGSQYHPRPELVCLENTHSSAGGRALPLGYLKEVRLLTDRYGLRIHMDGARLANAAVAQGVAPAQIAQHCDSVTLCFSKGLGAPAGAVLAGHRELVVEAWRARKLLGGGMRQAGVLAAAACVGLARMEETLRRDHDNARRFAQGVQALGSPVCSVNPAVVETNVVLLCVGEGWPSPAELCARLEAVSTEEEAETGRAVSLRLLPWSARCLRAVWHRDVSAEDTELAMDKLRFVAEKCRQEREAVS
ncbi:uncharacterized protein LOC102560028 isoform X2 [Alligator mississippiensis]|uniref:uncharacterized protein LOC102560028 isoform X2 n=1 Tax=Alligator mississippiensis TaxID=8496 RepID=UPI00287740E7|nr:uncharacterized protein LOC102560028 isoform X2 [Alligator mississippiensis]